MPEQWTHSDTQFPPTQINKFADNENKSEFIQNMYIYLYYYSFVSKQKQKHSLCIITCDHCSLIDGYWLEAPNVFGYWMQLLLFLFLLPSKFHGLLSYHLNIENWTLNTERLLIVNSLQSKFVCWNSKFIRRMENWSTYVLCVQNRTDLKAKICSGLNVECSIKCLQCALDIPCTRLHHLEWYRDTMSRKYGVVSFLFLFCVFVPNQ